MLSPEQSILGGVFSAMGLATLFFPGLVHEYGFEKAFVGAEPASPAMLIMIQCFGSQAALCGLTILSTKWTRRSYRNFALAMVPYLVFDVYALAKGMCTPFGAIGDGIGNVIFVSCCYVGYYRRDKDDGKPLLKH
ncbi:Aste57867_21078 [Aphanomyces stellatus]|uniref:Aste57867_21078 protein n=1 Tax=Aphanomyces stellatus TaxID=120398 RepID=A0A485LH70_9STRA|nr:hypothetical protein As57867_021010 [Aphanomyces stellatus]VFT97752.1 Aste57867_21078 [Aphanomyces stellatus]